jgi:hypothetical protein
LTFFRGQALMITAAMLVTYEKEYYGLCGLRDCWTGDSQIPRVQFF